MILKPSSNQKKLEFTYVYQAFLIDLNINYLKFVRRVKQFY